MVHEVRTVCFDKNLKIEAYCFKGIMQKFAKTLDYRSLTIPADIMRQAVWEITGRDYLPRFTQTVLYRSELVTESHLANGKGD